MDKSEYHKYLASREWALLKEQVKDRAKNKCERCKNGACEVTHHITYERIGRECLEDLLGLCQECHKYLSGKSDHDPAAYRIAVITDGIARIRKAKGMVGYASDLMQECFPDNDYENCYYDLAMAFSVLLKCLNSEIERK